VCVVVLAVVLHVVISAGESSSVSSRGSNVSNSSFRSVGDQFPRAGDSYPATPTSRKPFTSSPALHVHTHTDHVDLDRGRPLYGHDLAQGHHRRGSSGDKNMIQITPELKHELAYRMSQQRKGAFVGQLFMCY